MYSFPYFYVISLHRHKSPLPFPYISSSHHFVEKSPIDGLRMPRNGQN